ncbi:MAG: PQQ-binding-like beta-propeller repeat protein, partial [Phycisphaerales bacterium]|nr:PQQ-binding-like beta-propeller repeat protein [Phycisphaerales bacterium]
MMAPGVRRPVVLTTGAVLLAFATPSQAQDWPMWGRTPQRNMVAPGDVKIPTDFYPGDFIGATDEIDPATTSNVAWIAKLGSQSYGNVTIADGRVFVGTNNDSPRQAKYTGDRSVVYCFNEEDGSFLWELNFAKLGTGKVSDWEYLGICSSPAVVGDRIYFVSNLCEITCADVHGMANGNDGPFTDESTHLARSGPALELGEKDGDILWTFNMIDECGVFPHNISSTSVFVHDGRVWAATSNGVDYGHVETPAPFAPCLVQVSTEGDLIGEESSGLSQRIFHSNWTSPTLLSHEGLELCIFGGPDGWVYGFEMDPEEDEEGFMVLKEAFRFDANPPEYRVRDGKPIKYATAEGPSEVISTPVVVEDRVYVTIGQDPEHGAGVGNIVCIDATKRGDITKTGEIWSDKSIERSLSTPSVVDGLVFVSDFSGYVSCYDADTGELYWRHDTLSHIWGSTLVAGGLVIVGNEDGYVTMLKAGRELEVVAEVNMMSPIYASPVVANGTLYL